MSYSGLIEEVLDNVGGCGRFQWLTGVVAHGGKAIVAISMVAMAFNGQQPDFHCTGNVDTNATEFDNQCSNNNGSTCDAFVFKDNMKTAVSEYNLVCDYKWTTAMITTIQMFGVLVGCFVSGHLADHWGRKPTFYLSLFILVVFNVVAIFMPSWQLYAAVRFFIGMGIGGYLTVHFNVIIEFSPTIWRARIVMVPSWPLASGFFAFLCYLMEDWKHVHLATAVIGLPFLFTFCFVQESMRWLVTKGRYDDAKAVIDRVAHWNRKDKPDFNKVIEKAADYAKENEDATNYSIITLFKTAYRARLTLCLMFIWMSISFSYYGLTFGINSLVGNLYLNMFLMNTIEAPASFIVMHCLNRFGRKKCIIFFFIFTATCGLTVFIAQYVDTPHRGVITNVCALACKLGVASGWGCLIAYTPELYPTVVRSISYGLHNTAARVGGMIAPQIVFLNDSIPGVTYGVSATLLIISVLIICTFKDTNHQALEDTFNKDMPEVNYDANTKQTVFTLHGEDLVANKGYEADKIGQVADNGRVADNGYVTDNGHVADNVYVADKIGHVTKF